jgi:hypothetical protein
MVEVRDRRLMLTKRRELLQKTEGFPLDGPDPAPSLRGLIQSRNDSQFMIRIALVSVAAFALAGSALAQREAEVIDGIAAIVTKTWSRFHSSRAHRCSRITLAEMYRGQNSRQTQGDAVSAINDLVDRQLDPPRVQETSREGREHSGVCVDDRLKA